MAYAFVRFILHNWSAASLILRLPRESGMLTATPPSPWASHAAEDDDRGFFCLEFPGQRRMVPNVSNMQTENLKSPHGAGVLLLLAVLGLLLFSVFVSLGTWQVHRLVWKRDLIERIDRRVHAAPMAAPALPEWPEVTAAHDEYRHVRVRGVFLHDKQTLVWAGTDQGSGYWVITPLQQDDESIVLVNRGFVPFEWCGRAGQCMPGPGGVISLTGLLRMSEPPGFLRHNDPVHNSWYTRDLPAIAAARGLREVAPYFIDADATAGAAAQTWPQGGLTVLSFVNNHLIYLLTWYGLALMVLVLALLVAREECRRRR